MADHREKAEHTLSEAEGYLSYEKPHMKERGHELVALALAQATFALMEEQRTANLIAWSTAGGTMPSAALTTEIAARLEQ